MLWKFQTKSLSSAWSFQQDPESTPKYLIPKRISDHAPNPNPTWKRPKPIFIQISGQTFKNCCFRSFFKNVFPFSIYISIVETAIYNLRKPQHLSGCQHSICFWRFLVLLWLLHWNLQVSTFFLSNSLGWMAWVFRICHYHDADIAEKVGQAVSNVRPKRQRGENVGTEAMAYGCPHGSRSILTFWIWKMWSIVVGVHNL